MWATLLPGHLLWICSFADCVLSLSYFLFPFYYFSAYSLSCFFLSLYFVNIFCWIEILIILHYFFFGSMVTSLINRITIFILCYFITVPYVMLFFFCTIIWDINLNVIVNEHVLVNLFSIQSYNLSHLVIHKITKN